MQALYVGRFRPSVGFSFYTPTCSGVSLFPFGNSVNSYVWFSCKESISSCMALSHSLLWVSLFASSKLSDSHSSVSSTYSLSGYLWGSLLSLRGYLFLRSHQRLIRSCLIFDWFSISVGINFFFLFEYNRIPTVLWPIWLPLWIQSAHHVL